MLMPVGTNGTQSKGFETINFGVGRLKVKDTQSNRWRGRGFTLDPVWVVAEVSLLSLDPVWVEWLFNVVSVTVISFE